MTVTWLRIRLTRGSKCNIIHLVNEIYSSDEIYYERWITPRLRQAVEEFPVVVLTGARQVGKSTLLRNAEPFRDWRFRSMDDFDTLRQAGEDPQALWAGADRIVLDEVQKAPDLLSAIKLAVDSHPGRFRFVLSGSANLLLMKQVSESLAGRAIYFVLDPMSLGEAQKSTEPRLLLELLDGALPAERSIPDEVPDLAPLLMRGLMPPLLRLDTQQAWVRWWDGYITTYLERDLRQVSQIDALVDFRRLMELAALRSGQLLNQAEIARDAKMSQPTVHRYLNLLETTHLFERLPAYTANRTSRLVKSPKSFWNDTGLAVHLSGYYDAGELRNARELGAFFETLIYHHLRVLARLMTPAARLYFWRTQGGAEVDFVVEHGRRLVAIEVKRSEKLRYGDADGLRAFLKEYPEADAGLILYSGRDIVHLGSKIIAVPWTEII